MKIQMIQSPYDSGHKARRTGQGPGRFIQSAADQKLRDHGHTVSVSVIETQEAFPTEISSAFEIGRLLADRVRQAVTEGYFPLVLAGNCDSCIGTLAGMEPSEVGIIWLDAHGDFNTPETTISGFLDGMGLAMAAGLCWQNLTATIPGFRPIPARNILLVGCRDLDRAERELVQRSGLTLIEEEYIARHGIRAALRPALQTLQPTVRQIYFHLDLDVLDPAITPSNPLAPPGGLTVEQVEDALHLIQEQHHIGACAITSYAPELDPTEVTLHASIRLMGQLVGT
jgi:arginase